MHLMKWPKTGNCKRLFKLASVIVFLSIMLPLGAHAQMRQMTDAELSSTYATGFSNFSITDGLIKAYFNINTSVYAEMDSLKMGYYDNGSGTGWDEDWTNVSFGSASTDLVCKGIYIEAKFTNITDPATRTLDYIKVGTPDMTGPITADFNSFSGHIENPTDGVLVDGHRLNLGTKTITSTNSEFYVELNRTSGYWVYFNNATIN